MWSTPKDFFEQVNRVFDFDIDVCATQENAKCEKFFTESDDGLSKEWKGTCWMNPPYGRDIKHWVKKAYISARIHKSTVVCLLPARVDTKWWHDYCCKAEVYFIKGRLKFGDSKNSAPFPSALVIFRPNFNDIFCRGMTTISGESIAYSNIDGMYIDGDGYGLQIDEGMDENRVKEICQKITVLVRELDETQDKK